MKKHKTVILLFFIAFFGSINFPSLCNAASKTEYVPVRLGDVAKGSCFGYVKFSGTIIYIDEKPGITNMLLSDGCSVIHVSYYGQSSNIKGNTVTVCGNCCYATTDKYTLGGVPVVLSSVYAFTISGGDSNYYNNSSYSNTSLSNTSSTDYSCGIYPWTSEKRITKTDLQGLSKEDLELMRNEIYARHGWVFSKQSLNDYFSTQSWYPPAGNSRSREQVNKDALKEMSKLELENAAFILKFEKGLKN